MKSTNYLTYFLLPAPGYCHELHCNIYEFRSSDVIYLNVTSVFNSPLSAPCIMRPSPIWLFSAGIVVCCRNFSVCNKFSTCQDQNNWKKMILEKLI